MFEFFRVIDATHDDPTFVPCLSAPDAAFPFEWEPADGGRPQVFTTKTASVSQYSGRGWTEVKRLKDITLTVVVTEARVVVYCEKFTKGGGWVGFGVGGLAVALVANAVSHAKAASRRRGKLLVAQARYPWLSAVGAPTDKRGRPYALRLVVDAGTPTEPRTLALDVFLKERDRPDAWAATVATLAARHRLAAESADSASRPLLEQIASGSATGPFDLPAPVRVGASTPVAAVPAASFAERAYTPAPAEPAARPEAPGHTTVDSTHTLPDPRFAGCAACNASLTPGMPTCGRCGSVIRQPAPVDPADVRRPVASAATDVDDYAATTRRSAFVLPSAPAGPAVPAAGVSETQANPGWGRIEDTQVVPDFRPSLPTGHDTAGTAGSAPTVHAAPAPVYPPQRLSFGMTQRGTGPVAAPPEVWFVSAGLLVLAALVLYPVLKFTGPLVPHLFDGNRFLRAFAALFLEFAVVLIACGAALVALAWGLIRGSRVAQVLTCLLAAVVSLGEVIGTQSNEQGTPSVSTGIAVSCVLVTTVIVTLLVASTSARAFFAGDTRPAGVVVAATACLYLGGVAVLDGLLLMVAGTISHRLVWYGIGFAAVGLLLITGNALLRRASTAARGTTVAGFLAFAVILLVFAGKYDELSSTSTLVPLGLLFAATVGLLVPPRSQAFFAAGGSRYAPPLSRSPGLVVGVSVLLVAILAAGSIGLSMHDSDSGSDYYGDGNQASQYTPSYAYSSDTGAPVSSSSDITQADAQDTATATMESLEGNNSADVCDGDDLPSIDVYDYRIRDVSPQTSGTFQVSADVSLNDGTYETVSYLVTDDGAGSSCVESDSFDTRSYTPDDSTSSDQPSAPSVEPTDVPSVPSSGDPVPTDAPLPTTPVGAVVPYDSDTTPTSSDEIVQYRAGGLDADQTTAVSTVIGFMTYINQQDFQSAWNLTTYRSRAASPTASFKHGYATSRFYQVEFGEPSELAGDLIVVPARFVSRQDPDAQGDPDGVTSCSYWPQYMFTVAHEDGRWVVDTSGAYSARPELDPLKRSGDGGVYLNPRAQREDCS